LSHTDPDRSAAITDPRQRDILVITVDVTGDGERKTALIEQFKDTATIYQLTAVSAGGGPVDQARREICSLFGSRAVDQVPIKDLGLSVRALNCLDRAAIHTVSDLLVKSERQLQAIPNIGQKVIDEVKLVMTEYGLQLRQPINP
jgi:DNA-directed RNA polymerase alpha subunit